MKQFLIFSIFMMLTELSLASSNTCLHQVKTLGYDDNLVISKDCKSMSVLPWESGILRLSHGLSANNSTQICESMEYLVNRLRQLSALLEKAISSGLADDIQYYRSLYNNTLEEYEGVANKPAYSDDFILELRSDKLNHAIRELRTANTNVQVDIAKAAEFRLYYMGVEPLSRVSIPGNTRDGEYSVVVGHSFENMSGTVVVTARAFCPLLKEPAMQFYTKIKSLITTNLYLTYRLNNEEETTRTVTFR